jgi:hypothetical protein
LQIAPLASLYGGFFILDVRLVLFVLGLAVLASAGSVLAFRSIRLNREMIPWFTLGVLVFFLFFTVLFNYVFDYPLFLIRSFFEITSGG